MRSLQLYQHALPLHEPLSSEESEITATLGSKSTTAGTIGMPRGGSTGNSSPISDFFSSVLVCQVEASSSVKAGRRRGVHHPLAAHGPSRQMPLSQASAAW